VLKKSGARSKTLPTIVPLQPDFPQYINRLNFRQIYPTVLSPGRESKDHWHPTRHEVVLPLNGIVVCVARTLLGKVVLERTLRPVRRLEAVYIPPRFRHSFKNRSRSRITLLVMATGQRGSKILT
jgi:oxalate decarboxylase/phosphoglucose isomerase-like protein (cupin superfamily)